MTAVVGRQRLKFRLSECGSTGSRSVESPEFSLLVRDPIGTEEDALAELTTASLVRFFTPDVSLEILSDECRRESALARLKSFAADYEGSPYAPWANLALAKNLRSLGRGRESLIAYQMFLDHYPHSPLVQTVCLECSELYLKSGDTPRAQMYASLAQGAELKDDRLAPRIELLTKRIRILRESGK
jgi:hypothetical protein